MEKIMFALDIENNWPPVGSEGVWCERIGEHFKIKNTPFFIPNLAFNDVFSAELDSVNKHVFEFEVIERYGHSVIWLMNNDKVDLTAFRKRLIQLGCSYEGFPQFSLGAIDVPPTTKYERLDEIIEKYESKGVAFVYPVWMQDEDN